MPPVAPTTTTRTRSSWFAAALALLVLAVAALVLAGATPKGASTPVHGWDTLAWAALAAWAALVLAKVAPWLSHAPPPPTAIDLARNGLLPESLAFHVPALMMVVRPDGEVIYANEEGQRMLRVFVEPTTLATDLDDPWPTKSSTGKNGHASSYNLWQAWSLPPSIHDVIAKKLSVLASPQSIPSASTSPSSAATAAEDDGIAWETGDDERGWWQANARPLMLDGKVHLWVTALDVTQTHRLNARLAHQSVHDPITGLPNRRAFSFWVNSAVARLRAGHEPGAMLYLDLDQFKVLNDAAGHAAGDRLLVELADVLVSVSVPGEHVARLGGDEFGIVLDAASVDSALAAADRYLQALQAFSYHVDGLAWKASGSMGVALIDDPALTHQEILTRGDAACYLAKEQGGSRAVRYVPESLDARSRRNAMRWMAQLQGALRHDKLEMWVQEVRDVRRAERMGAHVEALVRWRDDDGELIQPSDFIPAAERFGMMPAIDRWVVSHTLGLIKRTDPEVIARCAINISGPSLGDPTFAEFLLDAIDHSGVDPRRVGIEITETSALVNEAQGTALLSALRARGVKVAIDDFGAGMASFDYLKTWPADSVKIDGSFIRARQAHPVNGAVIRAVVEIGKLCGLEVVAESVMSQDDLDYLQEAGVHRVQGFYLHYPEPWLDFVQRHAAMPAMAPAAA